MNEEHKDDLTFSTLADIPVFCVNREYVFTSGAGLHRSFVKELYTFKFKNGYVARVAEYLDVYKHFSGGHKYFLDVYTVNEGTMVALPEHSNDVLGIHWRGNALDMHEYLFKIEALSA